MFLWAGHDNHDWVRDELMQDVLLTVYRRKREFMGSLLEERLYMYCVLCIVYCVEYILNFVLCYVLWYMLNGICVAFYWLYNIKLMSGSMTL